MDSDSVVITKKKSAKAKYICLRESILKNYQDGKNPNEVLGFRSEVDTSIFKDFSKEIMNEGATILGGCCNVSPNYINALRSLKN